MSNDIHHEETYTHKSGKKYNVRWYYDYDMRSPLEEEDCHGATERLDWNPTDEEQLEQHIVDMEPEVEEVARLRLMRMLAYPSNRYDSGLYYDVLTSLHIARTEWGFTDHAKAVDAVEKDFAYLKGYYNEDWFYLTLGIAPLDEDGEIIENARDYCGGYESTILDNDEDNTNYRRESIEDMIYNVEYQLRRINHPNQLELSI